MQQANPVVDSYLQTRLVPLFALCKLLPMALDPDRFIESQLSALANLGLDREALAREEALLRSAFLLRHFFQRLADER